MATPPSEKVPTPFWVAPPLKSKISMPPLLVISENLVAPSLSRGGGGGGGRGRRNYVAGQWPLICHSSSAGW